MIDAAPQPPATLEASCAPTRRPLPAYRPLLPPAARLLPYLERIDAARLYSNRGPLMAELQLRLAALFGVPEHGVRTAASGTLALVLAILAHAGRGDGRAATAGSGDGAAEGPGDGPAADPAADPAAGTPPRPGAASGGPGDGRAIALMPAFTFVATAQAAELCGYRPVFVDVDPDSWTVRADTLRAHPDIGRAGLVLAAAPYGVLPDVAALARLQADTGVPVVIDAAAGFEALCARPGIPGAAVPMALSFHATKGFSTGEGGAVVWTCPEGQRRVLQLASFGFLGARVAQGPGLNAKMSEYHAAVGLAMLDDLDARRAAQARVAAGYARLHAAAGLAGRLHLPPAVSPAYALLELPDAALHAPVAAALVAAGIDARRWYGQGVDLQPHFRAAMPGAGAPLPVTRGLCARLLGLPTAPDLDDADIARVIAALATGLSAAGSAARPTTSDIGPDIGPDTGPDIGPDATPDIGPPPASGPEGA